MKRFPIKTVALACGFVCGAFSVFSLADIDDEMADISLEDLLTMTVSSASGVEESLRDAPASMVIISAKDMRQRGYVDLMEVFADLPGFDAIYTAGTNPMVAYQRGYRTPFIQRTLFMVNGKVDNHLWTHAALVSRQYPIGVVDRIEILYGPAGAVYGPNAFLGIVNIITKNSNEITESSFDVMVQTGSFDTQGIDIAATGSAGEFSFVAGAKFFKSDEGDLDDYSYWGFTDQAWLSHESVWGPLLDEEYKGIPLGQYANRSDNWGLFAELSYGNLKAGHFSWETTEGYGMWYPFDQVQPNQGWSHSSEHWYMEHASEVSDKLKVKTLLLKRENRLWGGWAEATVDWNPGMDLFSYVSISDWNSISDSTLFKQDFDYTFSEDIHLNGGIKYESKNLTKAYDLCGYWSTGTDAETGLPTEQCSSWVLGNNGPEGYGSGIYHSTADSYQIQPGTLAEMPSDNMVDTTDKGVYVQGIWDLEQWRINAGIRYDRNSLYGGTVNPRASAIYKMSEQTTLKFLYGEAFQEPAPVQLFGGWSGRAANPNLEPEEAKNIEFVLMHQTENWLHDVSFYMAEYDNVIKEEAENAGSRDIMGLEYRGQFNFVNFIEGQSAITGQVYYTYTDSESSITYDHGVGDWVERSSTLGDMAEHKINVHVNLPVTNDFNMDFRVNYVGERDFYSRNPLSDQGLTLDSYMTLDINMSYDFGPAQVALKVKNLTGEEYYHPGVEGGESGNDFSNRAKGFRNSMIPQLDTHYMLTVRWNL